MNQEILDQYQAKASIFKALGHPTRLFIIHCIHTERLSVKDLTEKVGVDISTMSKHLDILKREKIISGEKIKNQIFYSLVIPCILDFMECADRVINRR